MSAIYECECDSFEMYEEQDSFEMAEAVPGPGVPSGGLTGQVLKKRSDEDFDTEWADESGGGGGTSDYTQLSNKPQINGITLSGNKSGSDLGLVNAETGKGLSTNDYTTADKNKLSGIEAQANKTVIDDTLTNTGEAADAKAVGNKISQLERDVQDLQGDLAGLDAGDVAYDNSLTYAAGTVGKELGEQRNTLNHKADVIYDTASGDIASFPDGADGLPVKDLTVGIEPVQSGTGDPSPDNVRPISGWTGANVSRAGKNLFGGSYNELFELHIPSGTTVCAYCDNTATINYYGADGQTRIDYWTVSSAGRVFTLIADAYYFRFNGAEGATPTKMYVAIESAFSGYLPYSGTTIPISWQSSAGTVYGGTLDVTTGVLTVTMANILLKDIDFSAYTISNTQYFARSIADMKSGVNAAEALCSVFKRDTGFPNDCCYSLGNSYFGGNYICIRYDNCADSVAFISFLESTNAQFTYELATPLVIQLDPVTVQTLLGQNNIWADCGPSTVEYPADTKLYIQKINTPTDDDMVADANIASGKYFIINNTLYLSTTTILAGDPIKPGTNCTLTNLAEALNALNS